MQHLVEFDECVQALLQHCDSVVDPRNVRVTCCGTQMHVLLEMIDGQLAQTNLAHTSLLQFRRDLETALHVSVIVLFTIVSSCVTDCNCNL